MRYIQSLRYGINNQRIEPNQGKMYEDIIFPILEFKLPLKLNTLDHEFHKASTLYEYYSVDALKLMELDYAQIIGSNKIS